MGATPAETIRDNIWLHAALQSGDLLAMISRITTHEAGLAATTLQHIRNCSNQL
jgi:hypothetical protein